MGDYFYLSQFGHGLGTKPPLPPLLVVGSEQWLPYVSELTTD